MSGQARTLAHPAQPHQQTTWARWRRFWAKYWVPYLYISPFYILWAIFGAFPIAMSFYLAFHQWNGLAEQPKIWVGLDNFISVLKDKEYFWKSVYNTLFIGVTAHIPMLSIALVLAFLLNSKLVLFREFFRTAYFLPVITGSVAVSIVFGLLFGKEFGFINWVLNRVFGLPKIDWFGGTGFWIKPAIILLLNWRWIGWNMVIYLAGLQAIPNELYEAAAIDGARPRHIFWYITLPLMKPVVLFTLVLSTIGTMQIFDEPFMLVGRDGGLDAQGLTVTMYIFREAFRYLHFGTASAAAYLVAVMIIGLSWLNIRLMGGGRGYHEAEGERP